MGTQEALEWLRLEVAEVRASRERLVRAADADRRAIERALHDGLHQQLVALSVNVQLATDLVDNDPDGAKALLDELGRDVRDALNESAALAQRVYPPMLDATGLAATLRAEAARRGISAAVEVRVDASYLPEALVTIYLCWLDVLEHATTRATITVGDEVGALRFELEADGSCARAGDDLLRDRVEALGGRLTIDSIGTTRLSGSLPLSR